MFNTARIINTARTSRFLRISDLRFLRKDWIPLELFSRPDGQERALGSPLSRAKGLWEPSRAA